MISSVFSGPTGSSENGTEKLTRRQHSQPIITHLKGCTGQSFREQNFVPGSNVHVLRLKTINSTYESAQDNRRPRPCVV